MWMLNRRALNNSNSNIHERALRLRYEDKESSIRKRPIFDGSSEKVLVTDIFKVKNDLAHDIIKDVSELKESPYNLRSSSYHLTRRNVNATFYGLLTI